MLFEGTSLLDATGKSPEEHVAQVLSAMNRGALDPLDAFKVLARYDSPQTRQYLREAMDNVFPARQAAAIEVLAHLKDVKAVPAIVRALRSSHEMVRLSAARALAEVGEPSAVSELINALDHDSTVVRETLRGTLRQFRAAATMELLAAASRRPEAHVRHEAVRVLAEMGGAEAVPHLCEAAFHDDSQVQLAAIHGLGRIGEVRATLPLSKLLEHPKPCVCEAAAQALNLLGDKAALEALAKALSHNDEYVAMAAAEALAAMQDRRALSFLIARLDDQDECLACRAAKALGDIRDDHSRPMLLKALRSRSVEVLTAAIASLARIPARADTIRRLARTLKHNDWHVRVAVVHAYRDMRDARCLIHLFTSLSDHIDEVAQAAHAAERQILCSAPGSRFVPVLLKAVRSRGSRGKTVWAVQLLSQYGDERVTIPLVRLLWRTDPNASKRGMELSHAVALALGNKGSIEAIPGLLAMLKDGSRAYFAAQALDQLTARLERDGIVRCLDRAIDALQEVPVKLWALKAVARLRVTAIIDHVSKLLADKDVAVRKAAADVQQLLSRDRGPQ